MGVTFIAPEGVYTSPAKLITKTITENNTYNAADEGANGYSSVTVNVEGGGGGGSSDFTTAEVTIASELDSWMIGSTMPMVDETGLATDITYSNNYNPSPFLIALYKGSTIASIYNDDNHTIVVSGGATYEDGVITITGDCTITIS